jgi:hypothetical protein
MQRNLPENPFVVKYILYFTTNGFSGRFLCILFLLLLLLLSINEIFSVIKICLSFYKQYLRVWLYICYIFEQIILIAIFRFNLGLDQIGKVC